MPPSMQRSAMHTQPRNGFFSLRLLRLALIARLASQTLLASALLARFDMGGAAAQEQLLPGPLEHWDSEGNTWEFPDQGQYYFPEGDGVYVPGLGFQYDDLQIPNGDGSPAFDLRFVPFDEIPSSGIDSDFFGGYGNDTLLGGAGNDTNLLETYERNGGGFIDSIDGLAGDIDFINPQRDLYDPFAGESWQDSDLPTFPGAAEPGLDSWWDERLGW